MRLEQILLHPATADRSLFAACPLLLLFTIYCSLFTLITHNCFLQPPWLLPSAPASWPSPYQNARLNIPFDRLIILLTPLPLV